MPMPRLPETERHGRRGTYIHDGCRCDACRQANAAYHRSRVVPDDRAAAIRFLAGVLRDLRAAEASNNRAVS